MHPLVHRCAPVALAFAFLFAGCKTPEVALRPMERTPAAVGTIAISTDKNGNTVGELKMQHLPPPAMLSPELGTYVVWARPAGQDDYRNVGQVKMTNDRAGSTFIQMPFNSFEVLITAESVGSVQQPSEYKILEGAVGAPPLRGPEQQLRQERELTPPQDKTAPSPQSSPREENEPSTTPDT